MITFDHDTGKAQDAVKAARRRGFDVPADIDRIAGMWQVAVDAAHMQPPVRPTVDDVPATAEQLAALIEERARTHRVALAHQAVATDFLEPLARKFNASVREHAPNWVRALQVDFLALTKVLAKQAKKLPPSLQPQHIDLRDPAVSAPWETASNAAVRLDRLVADRQTMSRAVGQDLGKDSQLFAVAKIEEPSEADVFAHKLRDEIGPAIREWRDLKGSPTARWLHIARSPHLELSLALPGEVRQRQQVMDRWHEAVQVVMTSGLSRQQAERAVTQALRG